MSYDLYPLLKRIRELIRAILIIRDEKRCLTKKTYKIKFISMRQLGDKETIRNQTLKKTEFTYR